MIEFRSLKSCAGELKLHLYIIHSCMWCVVGLPDIRPGFFWAATTSLIACVAFATQYSLLLVSLQNYLWQMVNFIL